jgi:hypothetical protein
VHILSAVIYYQNCRFAEARSQVEEFERRYGPVQERLRSLLAAGSDAASLFDALAEAQPQQGKPGAGTDGIMQQVLRIALSSQDIKALNDSIQELEAELEALGNAPETFRYSELAKASQEQLTAQRASLRQKAGTLAKAKLERETAELARLIGDALRIKFEITSAEKVKLAAKLEPRGGGGDPALSEYALGLEVGEDQVYWPLEEEFWRDELGTYLYTLSHGCADRRAEGSRPGDRLSE